MEPENKPKIQENSGYDASKITVLEGLEAVRRRPGMYIGDIFTRGLHHLVFELVDNSIDEALAGYGNKILVIIHSDNSVTVTDNGRGIPTDIHPKLGVPAVEVALTKLHAGGKFDKDTYKVSGGLHGVGLSVVNALSSELEIWIRRNNKTFYQKYSKGKPITELKVISEASETGTTVRFKPDPEIMSLLVFSYDIIAQRLKELAYLIKGVTLTISDERESKEET